MDDGLEAIAFISYEPSALSRQGIPLEGLPWPVARGETSWAALQYTWNKAIFELGNQRWEACSISAQRAGVEKMQGVAWFFKRPK